MSGLKHLGVLENKELLTKKKKKWGKSKGHRNRPQLFMANENLSYAVRNGKTDHNPKNKIHILESIQM